MMIWEARTNRKGRLVPSFVCDDEHYEILAQCSWSINAGGYHLTRLRKGLIEEYGKCTESGSCLLHQFVWRLSRGWWTKEIIDHINTDRRDVRSANLRLVTKEINTYNKKPIRKDGTLTGIILAGGKWMAYYNDENGVQKTAYFANEAEAVAWREAGRAKVLELHRSISVGLEEKEKKNLPS